jgi:hypothetical protein
MAKTDRILATTGSQSPLYYVLRHENLVLDTHRNKGATVRVGGWNDREWLIYSTVARSSVPVTSMSSLFADDDEDDAHLPHSATASALETLQAEQLANVAAVAAAERAMPAAMCTPGSSSASITSSTAVATKVGVEHNLRLLINDQQSGTRLLLSSLPIAYKNAFGAKLDYKALGYSKLKDLLGAMPSLSICGPAAGGLEYLCMPPPPPPRRPAAASAQLQGTTLAPETVHVNQQSVTSFADEEYYLQTEATRDPQETRESSAIFESVDVIAHQRRAHLISITSSAENSRENVYSPSGEQPALAYEEAAKIAATRVATARWWPKNVLAALSEMSEGATCSQIVKLSLVQCPLMVHGAITGSAARRARATSAVAMPPPPRKPAQWCASALHTQAISRSEG